MIRLTWRLARPNIVASAALLAALALYAVLSQRSMSAYQDHSGLNACLAAGGDCEVLATNFLTKFEVVINSFAWLNLVPMLIGVFWGGPLIAREIEQGTHRLAWTQSISRGRWLAVRLGLFLLGAAVVAAALTQLMTWWQKPIERIQLGPEATFGQLNTDVFDFRGIVPIAYTLFAFALGAAAGAIFKRTVPAMAVTLLGYIPIKQGIQVLRGSYMTPLTETYPFRAVSPRANLGDWVLNHSTIDGSGNVVDRISLPDACRAAAGDRTSVDACLAAHGYRFVDTYHPIERFWPFQLIESGIFVGLAVVLLSLAVWWIIRRVA